MLFQQKNIKFLYDFVPSLGELPPKVFDVLTSKLQNVVEPHQEIRGVFLLSTRQSEPFVYSKSLKDFEKVKMFEELINSFNVKQLVKNLATAGYYGSQVIHFPEFTIGFIKITDTEVLSLLITAEKDFSKLENVESYLAKLKNTLKQELGSDVKSTLPTPSFKSTNSSFTVPKP